MKGWMVAAGLVVASAYVLWARARFQTAHLAALVRTAAGDPNRGRRAVWLRQGGALVAAVAAVAGALAAEQVARAFWIRIPLCLLVIGLYAPYASALAPVRLRKRRRGPAARMTNLGAPARVADAIATAGRPFAFIGSLVMLAAVLVLAWHHARS